MGAATNINKWPKGIIAQNTRTVRKKDILIEMINKNETLNKEVKTKKMSKIIAIMQTEI